MQKLGAAAFFNCILIMMFPVFQILVSVLCPICPLFVVFHSLALIQKTVKSQTDSSNEKGKNIKMQAVEKRRQGYVQFR